MFKRILVYLAVIAASVSYPIQADDTAASVVSVKISATFEEVRADVESEIINQGFVIDFNATVGEMLNRTAPDVGIDNPVFARAETWQFCSAVLTHQMVQADPMNLAFCPFVVFAYETAQAPGEIVVGFRRPLSQGSAATMDALKAIDNKLQLILTEVGQ